MFQEVQMPPALLCRVVHRAGRFATTLVRAGEARTAREVESDLKHTEQFVELHRCHLSRWRKPQGRTEHLEQVRIVHQLHLLVDCSDRLAETGQRLSEVGGATHTI